MEEDIKCPYCGIPQSFKNEKEQASTNYEKRIENEDEYVDIPIDEKGFIVKCKNFKCSRLFLVIIQYSEAEAEDPDDYKTIIEPKFSKKVTESSIPHIIRQDLNEAYLCQSVNSNQAACMMCRKVLEMTCNHFNASGISLEEKINDVFIKKPNEFLKEIMHDVRKTVNGLIHETTESDYG